MKNKCFLWGNQGGYFRLVTEETNPLLLNDETQWEEADGNNGWTFPATIKIFNNEEEYKNYRNSDVLWLVRNKIMIKNYGLLPIRLAL